MESIDNVNRRLLDDLKAEFTGNIRLSICAASFSIYAFEALQKELSNVESVRFVFNSPTFVNKELKQKVPQFFIPHIFKESELCGGEFELRLKNELNQRAIAKECSQWIKEKVTFKSNQHFDQPLQGLIYLEKNNIKGTAYLNVEGFNGSSLGITPRPGFPMMITKCQFPVSQGYLEWFNQVWESKSGLKDVTDKVQAYFQTAFDENSPEAIYFLTLYHIFYDFINDLSEESVLNEKLGFKDSVVWKTLYNFQKDAVVGCINKLEKYNGCILAENQSGKPIRDMHFISSLKHNIILIFSLKIKIF